MINLKDTLKQGRANRTEIKKEKNPEKTIAVKLFNFPILFLIHSQPPVNR